MSLKGNEKAIKTPDVKDGKPEAEKGKIHIQVTAWGTDPHFLFQQSRGRTLHKIPSVPHPVLR